MMKTVSPPFASTQRQQHPASRGMSLTGWRAIVKRIAVRAAANAEGEVFISANKQ
jgi:hypothetical protein